MKLYTHSTFKIYVGLILILLMPAKVSAEVTYYKTCISPSGKSIYDIALPATDEMSGEIRLRFENQDILYSAKIKMIENNKLIGVAKFKASRTGHKEADPWVFTYRIDANALIDDGRLVSQCD